MTLHMGIPLPEYTTIKVNFYYLKNCYVAMQIVCGLLLVLVYARYFPKLCKKYLVTRGVWAMLKFRVQHNGLEKVCLLTCTSYALCAEQQNPVITLS